MMPVCTRLFSLSALLSAFILILSAMALPAQDFSDGPYGDDFFTIAPDFNLPTLDGERSFRDLWTGEDSFIFLGRTRGNPRWDGVWTSDRRLLIDNSPLNVHYIFFSFASDEAEALQDIQFMKSSVDDALIAIGGERAEHFRERVHYVTQPANRLQGWLNDVLTKRNFAAFAIDRFQRLREVGNMELLGLQEGKQMGYLANEAMYFNYEWDVTQRIQSNERLIVPVFEEDASPGNRFSVDVHLPDAEALAQYDRLEVELQMDCPGRSDANCPEWDRLAHLYLCDDPDSDDCGIELARWITSYHRIGYWLTDVSQMLGFLREGGRQRFRFFAQDPWIISVNLHFSSSGGAAPTRILPLWTGGAYKEDYNANHPPIEIEVLEDFERVELYALITGHGWGAELDNCAEFCNHQHFFFVNDKGDYLKDHAIAGDRLGCFNTVADGVVPNQYGTWHLGRAGWCPGQDVRPYVVDVTENMQVGSNTISYLSLFEGDDYQPRPNPNSTGGFPANINMSSYLVFWGGDADRPDLISSAGETNEDGHWVGECAPNPLAAGGSFRVDLKEPAIVRIEVSDLMGGQPTTPLFTELRPAGPQFLHFDASGLAAGSYVCRLQIGSQRFVRKINVLR